MAKSSAWQNDDADDKRWFPRTMGDLASVDGHARQPRDYRSSPEPIAAGMDDYELRNVLIAHAAIILEADHAKIARIFHISRPRITTLVNESQELLSKAASIS